MFGVPQPSPRPRGCHVPAPSPLKPSPELGGQLGGGTVTVTVTVTHSTPSRPRLLHGDIVPAGASPEGRGGRPGGDAPGTDSVPAAEPGSVAAPHTAPTGTSDSMGTHDQVLGFLTQRDWWQWVARSPWWLWPDCRTLHSAWLWPWPRQGCDLWHEVSCCLCHTLAWHILGSARPCHVTCPVPHCGVCHILCPAMGHIPTCAMPCVTPCCPTCPTPCHIPCALARTSGTTWPPEYLPTATRTDIVTKGPRDTMSQ